MHTFGTSLVSTMQGRRYSARMVVMVAMAAVTGSAIGESNFPTKPVNIVTPFAAGSGPDAVLRQVSEKLSKLWKQPVIVNNKPGGGGFVAYAGTQQAAADGYTLLQLDSEHLSATPYLYKSRKFVPLEVYEPVATLFRTPFLLSVPADSKWKSVKDLVDAARAQPGKVNYGSWGVGSPGHLGAEALEFQSGASMQHVPFREVSQLYSAVANKDVEWAFATIPSSQGMYKAGKIRYLAVAAPKRIPQMPNVPTFEEVGGPANFEVNSFAVIVAPKGIPDALKAKINADVQKVLADPDIRERFNTFAFEVLNWTPEEIRRNSDLKAKTYSELIQRKKITLE